MRRMIKYFCWLLVFSLTGCQDFLEPKSQSEFVPKLVASLDEMLLGEVYMGCGSDATGRLFSIMGLFDDDVTVRPGLDYETVHESKVENSRLLYSWSEEMATKADGYNIYGTCYGRILGCNAVLDYVDGVQGTVEDKNFVKAQALTMRAYFYFQLVNLYAKPYFADKDGMGVPLKLTSALSTESIARSSVGEVYGQMVKDLKEAERLFLTLPEEMWWRKNNRANLPLAQLLLSRVYLYMEDWGNTILYGEKVIKDYHFNILDLNTIPEPVKTAYPSYPDYFTWENPEVVFVHGNRADVISLPTTDVQMADKSFKTICIASDSLIKSYDLQDLRLTRYLVWEPCDDRTSPVYRVAISKFERGVNFSSNNTFNDGAWGVGFKVTEAYLNVAEAAAMEFKLKGNAADQLKALNYLDALRGKRYPTDSYHKLNINSADELVKFTRKERRRELCFENHRWFDLRRYGMDEIKHKWSTKGGGDVEYILEKNDPGFVLQIPQEAFTNNTALKQNEKRKSDSN